MKKATLLSAAVLAYCILQTAYSFSQGTAINTNGNTADQSAILDVSSASQGLLIPRLTEAQKNIIPNPATSLMIFQTDGAVPGYYYNAGTPGAKNWVYLGNDNLGNHTATDSLNMSMNKIVNLATCTNNYDAANKLYVDNSVAAGGGGGGGHYLGEIYEGGKIFWIDGAGTHGLIAYSRDFKNLPYSNISTTIGDSAQDNNNGDLNSYYIVNQSGHTYGAAYTCDTLIAGGYTDWYLPASFEMYILMLNQQYVGGFNPMVQYWSSTESQWNTANAVYIQFDATPGADYWFDSRAKTSVYSWMHFRCIRKF